MKWCLLLVLVTLALPRRSVGCATGMGSSEQELFQSARLLGIIGKVIDVVIVYRRQCWHGQSGFLDCRCNIGLG